MRIGVCVGNITPTWGGAFSFESSIMSALERVASKHEIFVFHLDAIPEIAKSSRLKLRQVMPTPRPEVAAAARGALKHVAAFLRKKSGLRKIQKTIRHVQRELDELSFMRDMSHPLNASLLENKIDIVWFPSILHLVPVKLPFVMTLWDFGHRVLPIFPEVSLSGLTWEEREKIYQAYLRRASHIFIGTTSGKEDLQFLYNVPAEHISVNPHPVPDVYRKAGDEAPVSELVPMSKFLLYPAQFWPHKNHILCLKTLALLRSRGHELDFVFTGSDQGNLEYIKAQARKMDLERYVHFLGFVGLDDLRALYQRAECMVFATFLGPDNLPPLEAFQLGCPVVASNIRGAKDQLGDAALLADPKSAEDFASKVEFVVTNRDGIRDQLRTRGAARVAPLTSDNYVRNALQSIESLGPYRECWSSEREWVHL